MPPLSRGVRGSGALDTFLHDRQQIRPVARHRSGYPISRSQFCMSTLRLSNGIFSGWSARNFDTELSVMRPPFVSRSFSATQY